MANSISIGSIAPDLRGGRIWPLPIHWLLVPDISTTVLQLIDRHLFSQLTFIVRYSFGRKKNILMPSENSSKCGSGKMRNLRSPLLPWRPSDDDVVPSDRLSRLWTPSSTRPKSAKLGKSTEIVEFRAADPCRLGVGQMIRLLLDTMHG